MKMPGRLAIRMIMSPMKRYAIIAFAWTATFCCSALLHGQDGHGYLPDQAGVWRTDNWARGTPKATAAELAALRTALTSLEQAVHATPMLTAPRGFDIRSSDRLDLGCPVNSDLCRQAPLPGWIKFSFEGYSRWEGKTVTQTIEPPHVDVAFNDPGRAYFGHEAGYRDPSGNVIVGPLVEVERVGNVVLYDTGVVLLGRNPRPFWVPVTREDYLRGVSAKLAASTSGSDALEEAIRGELAALTPEERRLQAYTHRDSPAISQLAPASMERATPLYKFNPAYFDAALPRTAIQLITVTFVEEEHIRQHLGDRPDLLERSPITPERLAFLDVSGVGVAGYRIFELERLMNYSGLSALLAAPAASPR